MREAGYKYNRWTTGTAGQSIYLFLENDLYLYIYRELHRLSDIALGYGRKLHVQTQDLQIYSVTQDVQIYMNFHEGMH